MLPESLAREIAEESVRWDLGQPFAIASFLDKYTLHDSNWIGMQLDTSLDGDATAIISFDAYWNKVGVQATPQCSEWPILLIRFSSLASINLSGYNDIGGISRGIHGAETEDVGDGTWKTVIADHYGGKVSIVHRDPVKALCFTSTGDRIEL
jgi:hypothetical protein